MSTLAINFTAPTSAPSNGYVVFYRIKGSLATYTQVNGTASPINIIVQNSFNYEGYIKSNCGSSTSPNIFFETDDKTGASIEIGIESLGCAPFTTTGSPNISNVKFNTTNIVLSSSSSYPVTIDSGAVQGIITNLGTGNLEVTCDQETTGSIHVIIVSSGGNTNFCKAVTEHVNNVITFPNLLVQGGDRIKLVYNCNIC